MKKDVLILTQSFYPEYVTSSVLAYETALDMKKKGLSVDVLCGYPNNYNAVGEVPMEETVEGVTIRRINYANFNKNKFVGRILNYFAYTTATFLNIRKMKNYKTIMVYSTPPVLPIVSAVASKLYKAKVIFVSYDIYPEIAVRMDAIKEDSLISKTMSFINKVVFNNVSKVVALSTEMKEYIVANRKIAPEDVVIIPNWANEITLKDKKTVNNPLFSNIDYQYKTVISYFGNMGVAQDMESILNAIRTLQNNKDVFFLFAGHGKKMDDLKLLIKNEKLDNVQIFDFLHGEDYQDALAISDAFIVSLEGNLDGLCVPSKTYSYMSAGRPVISIMDPNCDVSQDLINHEAGFAISNGDSQKLVDVILKLQDKEVATKMGENCQSLFLSKYTREIGTSAYANLVKHVSEDI